MNDLYEHQKEAISFLLKNQGGYLAYGMGLGKTRIILESFKAWKPMGYKLLVICPLSLINTAWKSDMEKFTPDLIMCDLHSKHRRPADVYVINYDALISPKRYAELVHIVTTQRFVCVLDESSMISNPRAKRTRNLLTMKHAFKIKVCMSGTPCSQSEEQLWSQITFLRDGILSPSFYGFRNTFFHLQRGRAVASVNGSTMGEMMAKGWKLSITPQKREQLMTRLKPVMIMRKLDECVDLPDEIDQVRSVEMTQDQATAYKAMKQNAITEIKGKDIVAQIALTKLMKLRQITSGFAIDSDGYTTNLPVNPKLDELMETLQEIGNDQAVIFFNFKAEAADIKSRLSQDVCIIDGETTDKASEIGKFIRGEYRYLAANIQSMAHGVTLTNAHYCIYYSHSYSLEDYLQSRARIRRIGQNKTCVYIHLLCKDTIDEIVHGVLKRKGQAAEIIQELIR